MALKRMDNVGIVVDDLAATIEFFRELGLELEGRATIEGEWAGRVTGLGDQRVVSIKTRIGSATSAGPKGFSSDSPKNSAERNTKTSENPPLQLPSGPLFGPPRRSTVREKSRTRTACSRWW